MRVWRVCLLGLELPSCSLLLSSLLSLVALQHWCQGGAPSHHCHVLLEALDLNLQSYSLRHPFLACFIFCGESIRRECVHLRVETSVVVRLLLKVFLRLNILANSVYF